MTSRVRIGFAVSALLSTVALSSIAAADVAPPDACNEEGSACQSAGSGYDENGTCSKRTCTRTTPDLEKMEYECLKCVGGASGSEPTGGTSSATGGSKSSAGDDDGGCAVAPAPQSPWSGLSLVAAGLAFALVGRRLIPRAR